MTSPSSLSISEKIRAAIEKWRPNEDYEPNNKMDPKTMPGYTEDAIWTSQVFLKNQWFMANIFDGHGGKDCVDFVSQALPRELDDMLHRLESPEMIEVAKLQEGVALPDALARLAINTAYRNVSLQIDAAHFTNTTNLQKYRKDGACALTCLIRKDTHDYRVFCGNIGDCRAIAVSCQAWLGAIAMGHNPTNYIDNLSYDHNISSHSEFVRIRQIVAEETNKAKYDKVRILIPDDDNTTRVFLPVDSNDIHEDDIGNIVYLCYDKGWNNSTNLNAGPQIEGDSVKTSCIQPTRSFGDLGIKGYCPDLIIDQPEILYFPINEDSIIIMGTDGLWDHIQPQEAIAMIMPFIDDDSEFINHGRDEVFKSDDLAAMLVEEARKRWVRVGQMDDISAVVIYLP